MPPDAVLAAARSLAPRSPATLFAGDPDRARRFTREAFGLVFDWSRRRVDDALIAALPGWFAEAGLSAHIAAMFAGQPVNATEGRAALHMAWRAPDAPWSVGGENQSDLLAATEAALGRWAQVLAGADTIIHLGIGGSDLGPRLVWEALRPAAPRKGPHLTFAANADPAELARVLAGTDPRTTRIVIASKSFTTSETLANAAAACAWLAAALGDGAAMSHVVAVTANRPAAMAWGLDGGHILDMPEWVGGRFSVWSAVGVSVAAALGMPTFAAFRAGAAQVDAAVRDATAEGRVVFEAAALDLLDTLVHGARVRGVFAYAHRLRLLYPWLQQLEMESNGKGVALDARPLAQGLCAPLVWGGEGTIAQHAVFQHLHQAGGQDPVELVLVGEDGDGDAAARRLLNAHGLAQAETLMIGRDAATAAQALATRGADPALAPHLACPGGRPVSVTLMPRLDPAGLGSLMALHEHRVAVWAALAGFNAFDQFGVELGKGLAPAVERALAGETTQALHPATAALVQRLRGHSGAGG
jgi:glucose-6-phosphate isomerase